jgi:hypothetical protein
MLPQLPRNVTGKVRKALLRRWLAGEAELQSPCSPAQRKAYAEQTYALALQLLE